MTIVEYTDFLVKSLVDDADMVKVDSFETDEDTTTIEIVVPNDDMKVVVGKNGKNANAIRTLIQAFAYVHGLKKIKINIDSY